MAVAGASPFYFFYSSSVEIFVTSAKSRISGFPQCLECQNGVEFSKGFESLQED